MTFAAAAPAQSASREVRFAIAAQPAGQALVQFGVQAGIAIAFTEDTVRGMRSRAVTGVHAPADALAMMFRDCGLGYEFLGPSSVRVFALPRTGRGKPPSRPAEADRPSEAGALANALLDEVIVTSQKRAQNIQDVPIAVTAVGEEALARTGADRFETYLALAPGVSFAGQNGNSAITIRGISTSLVGSNQQGTVEVLLDDMPSLNRYFARFNSDLRLTDVDRVEVLRGPQGTLFGSGSLGGAVRIISHKPDASAFAGEAQASVSSTAGGGPGHEAKAMVNVPLIQDRLALRVAGYSIREGGFIDNPARGETNVNAARAEGVRAMLRYTPDDRLAVTAWAWRQDDRTGGDAVAFLNAADGGPYQSGSVDREDATRGTATLYNLTGEYDFGPVRLLSTSSYVRRRGVIDRDYSTFWQAEAQYDGDVEDDVASSTRMFSQEVRLASDPGGRLQWVAGAFYLQQQVDVDFTRTMAGLGAAKGYPSDLLSRLVIAPETREAAIFGEVTYAVNERLSLTAGARGFRNTLKFASDRSGYLGGIPTPPRRKSESSVTPKFAAVFRLNADVNLYAQAAKGYRTGQNNFIALPDPATGQLPPDAYGPDNLWNYELGLKARWLDRRLTLNVAAFHIDWENIQLTRRSTVTTFTDNAGNATSRGVEVELEATPFDWLSFGVAPAYTDARLRSVLPGVPVLPGPLPGSPKWMVSDFIQVTGRFRSGVEAFARLDHRFVGRKDAGLETPLDSRAASAEAYHALDLHLGVERAGYAVVAFARNLTNGAAATGPRELANTPPATTRQTPRTIGLEVRARF